MRNEELPQFARLLAEVMAGYGKPLPETSEINTWFRLLAQFSPSVIRRGFDAYVTERPDFVPTPIAIVARCKLLDGRPGENEAWAQALLSESAHATVIWTDEMAEAFTACQPLLQSGDQIGARMAFKDAYGRLVALARSDSKPVRWRVSEGWSDRTGGSSRRLAIEKAQRDGLLPAPEASKLLLEGQGKDRAENAPAGRPEGLKRVMAMIAGLTQEDPFEKAARLREERMAEEDAADGAKREAAARKALEYLREHPEARYGKLKDMKPGARKAGK